MSKRLLTYLFILPGLLYSVHLAGQEQRTIYGKVLNDQGEPVNNVTISIPGREEPVYTNEIGSFEMPNVNENEWILIQPLDDYHEKHLLLKDQDSITIYLTSKSLDSRFDEIELPVKTKHRRDVITSFNTIDATRLHEKPYSSIGQYFQGRTSGIYVSNNSGMPGSGVSMYIRGYSSLLSNNQPLYIVDGMPLENSNIYDELIEGYNHDPLSTIDPLDISELVILKDAAATAMYGMKGANGVVFIKTLEPQETKTNIDILVRTGISMKPNFLPQLNANQYKNLANEILFSSKTDEEKNREDYPGLFYTPEDERYIVYNHNKNWQNEIYDNATMQNLRFSIKGGGAIANYGLSVSYLNNEGIFKNTDLNRINIRLVGSFGIFSWLKMNIASNLTTVTSQLKESAIPVVSSPTLSALFKSPLLNPYEYDSDGNLINTIAEVEELGTSNPTAVSELLNGTANNYRFLTKVSLDGDITENIKFSSMIGLNSNNLKEYLFIPDRGFDLMYNNEVFNVTKAQNTELFSVYNDNQVSYESPLYNSNHFLHASIGVRWQKFDFQEDWGIGKNTASDEYTNLQRGFSLLNELGGRNSKWNWGSVYSNIMYSYRDKYLLSGSVSADISSRLGDYAKDALMIGSMPSGLFYSISGAWRISEEKFFSDLYAFEELKLRVSYGVAGNDDIGETNTFNHYSIDQYRETSVLIPGTLANEELTFQLKTQFNIGMDISMLANRVFCTFNYFNNVSTNLLILELQNSYLGYDNYPTNSAGISTSGVETGLNFRVVNRNDFTLDIGANFTKYKSLVKEISGGEQVLNNYGNMTLINRVGEPVNSFYGYRYLGVYKSEEEASQANLMSDRGVLYGAGDAIFENVRDENGNVDNIIDKNDKQILGSFEPDFFGGLFLHSRYKNWSMELFFQGVYGNEIFNYIRYQNEKMTDLSNQSVKVLQRWQYDGQETNVPKATWGDPAGNNSFSDRWIEDGSYLRLKELTLTYDVNKKFLSLNNFKIFVTATNLFTLSAYKGYDPEFSYSTGLMDQGVDYGLMPLSRGFMAGVKIGL